MPRSAAPHLHWIDALKVLVVGGIALFHTFLVFSGRPWLVNNPEPDVVMAAFDGFVFQWGMALMFVLAGGATWFALRRHSAVAFLGLRWQRLGLPFVVALVVLSPLQAYVAAGGGADFGRLLAAYPAWFRSLSVDWHLSSTAGITYHLWFLAFLLAISTLLLPLLAWLGSERSAAFRDRLATRSTGRFGFLWLGLPVAAVVALVQPAFPGYEDWGDLAKFAALFAAGFLVVSDPRFGEGLRHQARSSLAVAVAASAAVGLVALPGIPIHVPAAPVYDAAHVAFAFGLGLNTWAWVAFFLSVGVRLLDADSPTFRWLGELSLPFYVLHHPVLVLIAVQVVKLDWGPWPKAAVILAGTLSITFALCLVVERTPLLRDLFGLRPPSAPTAARPRPSYA